MSEILPYGAGTRHLKYGPSGVLVFSHYGRQPLAPSFPGNAFSSLSSFDIYAMNEVSAVQRRCHMSEMTGVM
ncbi:hypothetical protein ITP53_50525 [Nonomuraea sp. K274]|uniref:Uncharacterized protein n=1 Tax=Nonomuraea cypriaca TaxID=1187855 RepID=A0A931AKU3_9ACTN|nr:hypothetical protein [Nonomuraea cypriaca]MBF8193783.1 hypothetical protein [Nonomuraea cypriaca]